MKKTFTKFILFSFLLIGLNAKAQNGLDSIIVEKYYISNAADSIGSIGYGNLPVGSVTYRIYVDMKQGYKFQMAYGSSNHPLSFNTTTSFFNNEDRGATNPTFTKAQAKNNTVMLDSWLTAGAACVGNFGVLKTVDDGVATVVNADGILLNANPAAGIPLSVQDGFLAGNPGTFGTVGLDTAITVFDATSQLGNSFYATNGGWYCLAGAMGPDTITNQLLIAQITTDGQLSFKLNIQIGTPSGGSEKYVADNPTGTEIQRADLTYVSDSINNPGTVIKDIACKTEISIYPNPSNGVFRLNINTESQNPDNYYTIYNLLGNVVLKKKLNSVLDNYKENIDLSSVTDGIYFIEMSVNGVKTTRKLIKK
ncbi:MAG: T9SS type A sorting domain-containing protein [Bacteroidota bacterium]